MDKLIDIIREKLVKNADEKTRATQQHYFKEEIRFYGVTVPTVDKISKEFYYQIKDRSKAEIIELCERLFESGNLEESFVACHLTYSIIERFEPEDFKIFERWIQVYVNNWATCDTLCNHSVGAFIEKYPVYIGALRRFASSENRWARRAAAVTLIIPARKGLFLNEILEIADILLLDPDDLVQKGYGWMLKAASEANQLDIFDYVLKNRAIMPRTALRYAIEKMPEDLKRIAMQK